ncbi:MAG: hypothetical protein WA476_15480 [Acidobacteriaceae bacterium]
MFALYVVAAGFASFLAVDAERAYSIMPKSAGGIVMAHTFLTLARSKTTTKSANPQGTQIQQ